MRDYEWLSTDVYCSKFQYPWSSNQKMHRTPPAKGIKSIKREAKLKEGKGGDEVTARILAGEVCQLAGSSLSLVPMDELARAWTVTPEWEGQKSESVRGLNMFFVIYANSFLCCQRPGHCCKS